MKQCPNCKNTYTDETLKFCLADGKPLIALGEAEKTISMSGVADETIEMKGAAATNPVRVGIEQNNEPDSVQTFAAPFSPQRFPAVSPEPKSYGFVVGILVALLIVVVLGFAGFAAYVYFKPQENKTVAFTSPTPTGTPKSDSNENLQEKLANLEKRLEDQQKPNPTRSNVPVTQVRTARANSPSDGFLALRSLPNSETGTRLAKIPHGDSFTVLSCLNPANPGKSKGRWCRVNYEGVEGWAFDAYMIFEN